MASWQVHHDVAKGGNLSSARHNVLLVWVSILGLVVAERSSSTVAYAQSAHHPSVTMTRPANGQTNVLRDVFVSADVSVPNGGINPATRQSDRESNLKLSVIPQKLSRT